MSSGTWSDNDGGSGTTQGEILQAQQFVYDGLTLLRVDQLYDSDQDEELEMTDGWRVWWENTTMPALLGGLLAKRVYSYPNDQSGTSNGQADYYYSHDAVGASVKTHSVVSRPPSKDLAKACAASWDESLGLSRARK